MRYALTLRYVTLKCVLLLRYVTVLILILRYAIYGVNGVVCDPLACVNVAIW